MTVQGFQPFAPDAFTLRRGFCYSFVAAFAQLRKATISSVTYVCPFVRPSAWKNSVPTGRIFMKFDVGAFFFENLSRKLKFHENPTRITGILHEDFFTFCTASREIILRMRNVLDKSCRENLKHTFYVYYLFLENLVAYDIMSKNMVVLKGSQVTSQYGAYALHAG
jgi:hypothetical protein